MENKGISFIIPAYNAGKYIERCVNSIICYHDILLEVIIIDDGSTDNTLDISQSISEQDNRVKVYTQENKGVSVSRNVGVKKSIYEYICFVDADDLMSYNWLTTINGIEDWNFDLLDVTPFLDSNKMVTIQEYSKIVKYPNVACWNHIFRKGIIQKYGIEFHAELVVSEDSVFLYTYLMYCTSIMLINTNIYCHINNENSVTSCRPTFGKVYSQLEALETILNVYKIGNKYVNIYIYVSILGIYKLYISNIAYVKLSIKEKKMLNAKLNECRLKFRQIGLYWLYLKTNLVAIESIMAKLSMNLKLIIKKYCINRQ